MNNVNLLLNSVTRSGSKVITFDELIIYTFKQKKMKKTILTMASVALFAVTATTSFGQNTDKNSDKAREDLVDAKKDLNAAQQDSIADYQNFINELEASFLNNEKSLADFKVQVSKSDVNHRAEYEKNLAVLNQKNVDLRKRMVDYKQNGETKWSSFKTEFNNDMDDFGKELKDFTVDNK